jgi:molybdenum cofactor biosynthesis protein A
MFDSNNRKINYLRISVTDRCNLRCVYCMPHLNMQFMDKSELLSYEELTRLISIYHSLGVNKIRFTGGEPFVRKDFILFLERITVLFPTIDIHLTTNGVLIKKHLETLLSLNIKKINISLDTLDSNKFKEMTGFDCFNDVYSSISKALELKFKLKLNVVVQNNKNDSEILTLVDHFKDKDLDLRFIEEMPFNERGTHQFVWAAEKILTEIQTKFATVSINSGANSTSDVYQLTDYKLRVATIAAFTRSFCGTCNRIRLNAKGEMKTCLYGDYELDLRALLRSDCIDLEIAEKITASVFNKHQDGFVAENSKKNKSLYESLSKIGG